MKAYAPQFRLEASDLGLSYSSCVENLPYVMVIGRGLKAWRILHSEASTGWGGREGCVLAELRGYKRAGISLTLLAPRQRERFCCAASDGIRTRHLRPGKWRLPFDMAGPGGCIYREGFQIVATESSSDGCLLKLASGLAAVPLVNNSKRFVVPIGNPRVSSVASARLCDHVITTSSKVTAKLIELFNIAPDRISTVTTGGDTERFRPGGPIAQVVPEAQLCGVPLVGMVSVIRGPKGYSTLIRAALLLKRSGVKLHYVLVGDGPSRTHFEKEVHSSGLGGDFTFTGHREDIPEVMRALSVLATPSLHEAVPQGGLQALACGVPVVASDVGGIHDIIKPGLTGRLFPPGDCEGLAVCIEACLVERERTEEYRTNGMALVRSCHSLPKMLEDIAGIYRRHGIE